MGNKNSLSLVNSALQELGLPQAQTIASAQDDQTGFQCLGLLNSLCEQLSRAHDWHFLESIAEFTGDGVSDSFDLPADFGRIVNQTQWSSAMKRPMVGPVNSQIWSWVQYGIVSVGVYYRYRVIGNKLHVFPKLADGEKINFFYISKNWAINGADSSAKSTIDSDSDKTVFDDFLVIAGLKFKLWAAKGMDSAGLFAEFEFMLGNLKAQTAGAPVINLSGSSTGFLITGNNIPDGNWNVQP